MAVDNQSILDLAYAGNGRVAENRHVAPSHPEYFKLPPIARDIEGAKKLMAEAGASDKEFEQISIDDAWIKNACDAVAAQWREAGFNIKRTVLPGSTFWRDWTKYPYSATNWNGRPLGVQVLALAYCTGEACNETAFSDPEPRLHHQAGLIVHRPSSRYASARRRVGLLHRHSWISRRDQLR